MLSPLPDTAYLCVNNSYGHSFCQAQRIKKDKHWGPFSSKAVVLKLEHQKHLESYALLRATPEGRHQQVGAGPALLASPQVDADVFGVSCPLAVQTPG